MQCTDPAPFISSSTSASRHVTPYASNAARVTGLPAGMTTTPGASGTMLIAMPCRASPASVVEEANSSSGLKV